jgi:hypothetical protein
MSEAIQYTGSRPKMDKPMIDVDNFFALRIANNLNAELASKRKLLSARDADMRITQLSVVMDTTGYCLMWTPFTESIARDIEVAGVYTIRKKLPGE